MDHHHQQGDEPPPFSLGIEPQTRHFLSEAARWGKFLAIVGFVVCSFILLVGVFNAPSLQSYSGRYRNMIGNMATAGHAPKFALLTVGYVLIALLYLFPCLYLYRFSRRMQAALKGSGQHDLNASFRNLKSLFKYVGTVTILLLVLYVLAFIFYA